MFYAATCPKFGSAYRPFRARTYYIKRINRIESGCYNRLPHNY